MSLPQENPLSLEKILTLLTDLLASVSPEGLGESLTQTLRELTGARSVLLLSHQEDWEAGSRVYAAPAASAKLFGDEELRLLCPLRRSVELPRSVAELPAAHPLRMVLERVGVASLHRAPLSAAGEHLGSLLILDPPQTAAAEDVLTQLDRLTPLCALALRNLLCSERVIAQSRELAEYAEGLADRLERGAAQNLDYRDRLETIFTRAAVPLCYVSREGGFLKGNARFAETFGYTLDDVPTLAEWWLRAYPDPGYRAWVMTTWDGAVERAAATGTDIEPIEYQVTCKDGLVRSVLISGSLLGGDFLATFLDVTERRKADEVLRQKHSEMERFVYTVSHDLKSPLVTIKGFLGVLEEDLARGDAEAIASDMAFIDDAAGHMARLLDELLELSRIGRVVNPPTVIHFRELVDEALALVAGAIKAAQVEVVVGDVDVTLRADRRRLLEVLQNLVENAVKYRGNQAAPRITLSAEKRSGEGVFCVRDNGIGVAPKHQERIFRLFEKLDASSEGTGIGLALVSRILELYGGRIWVESEGAGQGSCFCFTLPQAMQPGQVS